MSGEPLDQLIDMVDPEACHLINLPNRIWVFGGPCNSDSDPTSLRDSFWRQTLTSSTQADWLEQLDRPEDHEGWWAFSGYNDLLQFERDACYLARATVIFSESPGSHAELGALALDDSILPRLLVVVQSKYLHEGTRESFLNLGPVKRVHDKGRRCVIGTAHKILLPEDDFQTIMDEISAWLPTVPQKSLLQTKNPTHTLILLADLVDLFHVSKAADLLRAITYFGVSWDHAKLERALKLLEFFRLVRLELRGSEPFWVRRHKSDAPWVNYTAKSSKEPFDRSRFKVASEKHVQSDKRKKSIFERPQ